MLVTTDEMGTPYAEAIGRLKYSADSKFEYSADLVECSREVLEILKDIDGEMAEFPDMGMPHTIDNWQEIEASLSA